MEQRMVELVQPRHTLIGENSILEIPRFLRSIQGDSMEPAIRDGQIAWVDGREELSDGEIGIFMLESGAVCKRLRLGANGRALRLESLNPAYAPIRGKALAGLQARGRVIGTAWPPDRG